MSTTDTSTLRALQTGSGSVDFSAYQQARSSLGLFYHRDRLLLGLSYHVFTKDRPKASQASRLGLFYHGDRVLMGLSYHVFTKDRAKASSLGLCCHGDRPRASQARRLGNFYHGHFGWDLYTTCTGVRPRLGHIHRVWRPKAFRRVHSLARSNRTELEKCLPQTGLQHLHEEFVHWRAPFAMDAGPEAAHGHVSVAQRRQH